MKLTDLAIDGSKLDSGISLQQIHSGLNLIRSDRIGPLVSISELIRRTLFGLNVPATLRSSVASPPATGYLHVARGTEAYRLTRFESSNSKMEIRGLTPSSVNFNSEEGLVPIDADTFRTFFVWDFLQASSRLNELPQALINRFPELFQRQSFVSESHFLEWKRAADGRRMHWDELQRRLATLEQQKTALQYEIENNRRNDVAQRDRVDVELATLEANINATRQDGARQRALTAEIDRQIEDLNLLSPTPTAESTFSNSESTFHPLFVVVYQRLDEIEQQLDRWRHFQSSVQARRVSLRDEMLKWNEMSLDAEEHPYHQARVILSRLEKAVGQAEQETRTEKTPPMEKRIDAIRMPTNRWQDMRRDLHSLCDELSAQFKQIRHRSAVAELKYLRELFAEIGANLEHLAGCRKSAIQAIRNVDSIGADAIEAASVDFMYVARQEGFLLARRRFHGSEPSHLIREWQAPAVDFSNDHHRLAELTNRRQLIRSDVARLDSVLHSLLQEKETWLERRRLMPAVTLDSLTTRLEQLHLEYSKRSAEATLLAKQIDEDSQVKPFVPNTIFTLADQYLSTLTGRPSWVRLNPANQSIESNVWQKESQALLSPGRKEQILVTLSILLATRVYFSRLGIEFPVVVENLLNELDAATVTRVLALLREVGTDGCQFLVLTDRIGIDANWHYPANSGSYCEYRLASVPAIHTVITTNSAEISVDRTADEPLPTPLSWRELNNIAYSQPSVGPAVHVDRVDVRPSSFSDTGLQLARTETRESVSNGVLLTSPYIPIHVNNFGAIGDDTPLRNIDLVDSIHLSNLAASGVSTVLNLLELDPDQLAPELRAKGFTSAQIDRWQAQAWLLHCVPGLVPSESRLLVACGVTEPEQLDATQSEQLMNRINRYLVSPDGQRLAHGAARFDPNRIQAWYQALRSTRARWRREGGYSRRARRHRAPASQESLASGTSSSDGPTYFVNNRNRSYQVGNYYASRPKLGEFENSDYFAPTPIFVEMNESERPPIQAKPQLSIPKETIVHFAYDTELDRELESFEVDTLRPGTVSRTSTTESHRLDSSNPTQTRPLKFYLNLNDPVEAAPSIGPKTAERFTGAGIRTIEEFLRMNAEAMATKIAFKRISESVVRTWQDQTRLVCSIPNLRGHDAQLLVAVGIRDAETLAAMNPRKLFSMVAPFAETKEGLKIIRSGRKPDLAEVTDWIEWAKNTRQLRAA